MTTPTDTPTAERPRRARRSRERATVTVSRRTLVGLGALAVVIAAAPAVAQVAGFTDVPPGFVHAPNIERLRDAGVTTGCGDGTRFCIGDAVNRGQMASFVARGGAQAYADQSVTTLAAGSGNVNGVPVTVSVTGAGEAPGRQHVVLQGSVTVLHASTIGACPCEVEAFVYRARDNAQGPSSWTVLTGQVADDGGSVSLPVTWAVDIVGGATEEYRVAVFVDGTTAGGLTAEASLTALTAPFGQVPTP